MSVIAVSGGFDPVHKGHIRMFKKAKEKADCLVVILNNDNWLISKKGFVFMPEKDRVEILRSIRYVDVVLLTKHKRNDRDMSVCKSLKHLRPDFFANGGDRKLDNVPEVALCRSLGIKMFWNVGGGKVESSSDLVKRVNR